MVYHTMAAADLFEAHWEDRGAELADSLDGKGVILSEHREGLAGLVADEIAALTPAERGPAFEGILRGYRERLHRVSRPDRSHP